MNQKLGLCGAIMMKAYFESEQKELQLAHLNTQSLWQGAYFQECQNSGCVKNGLSKLTLPVSLAILHWSNTSGCDEVVTSEALSYSWPE